jgi:hypothetical protein
MIMQCSTYQLFTKTKVIIWELVFNLGPVILGVVKDRSMNYRQQKLENQEMKKGNIMFDEPSVRFSSLC